MLSLHVNVARELQHLGEPHHLEVDLGLLAGDQVGCQTFCHGGGEDFGQDLQEVVARFLKCSRIITAPVGQTDLTLPWVVAAAAP